MVSSDTLVMSSCLASPPSLLVTQLNIEVHMDISHNELVLINLDACIEKGEVDARGGVVAGSILMENTRAHC